MIKDKIKHYKTKFFNKCKNNHIFALICSFWLILIIYFIVKLLGGNYFNAICENQKFIDFCNWLDNSWMKFVVSTIVYCFGNYTIYLAITKQRYFKDYWVILILLPASIVKYYFGAIGMIFDLLSLIIIPLIKSKGKLWLRIIVGIVLIFAFQYISLITKDIGNYMPNESVLVSSILTIDYYVMIILYYLYSNNRKEIQ